VAAGNAPMQRTPVARPTNCPASWIFSVWRKIRSRSSCAPWLLAFWRPGLGDRRRTLAVLRARRPAALLPSAPHLSRPSAWPFQTTFLPAFPPHHAVSATATVITTIVTPLFASAPILVPLARCCRSCGYQPRACARRPAGHLCTFALRVDRRTIISTAFGHRNTR
jgi:hypothetical protein